MSWEKKDMEIMDKIKKNTENLEIPEELLPENMMERLEKEERKSKKRKNRIIKAMAAAACFGAVSVAMWQLKGMDSITKSIVPEARKTHEVNPVKYQDYDSIYKKLQTVEKEKAKYDKYNYKNEVYFEENIIEDAETVKSPTENSNDKVSGTNVQVEGIDEADVVKNDHEYIYALDVADNKVSIVSMAKEKKVSEIQIIEDYLSFNNADMYVSNDILVVVGTYVNNETQIFIYDINDRKNPIKVNEISQQGNYNTSRLSGDYLYVMSDSYIRGELSKDNCVPKLEGKQIEADCVEISENVSSLEYEFIISIDLKSPKSVLDKKAVTKDSVNGYVYMSAENIYVTNYNYYDDKTVISKVGYKDGRFSDMVEGNVSGKLYGQFAMDEYNGYLRLVSTYNSNEETNNYEDVFVNGQTNIVYVLDGALQEVGKIDGIAKGERIYSARFMGNIGYFVTYYETDPLFKVDFSNPSKPVILGELKITGYSDYLHPWGENKLVGLGYVDNELKLSMFDVNDSGDMNEISRKVLKNCYYSWATENHRALMIDEELNLIGFLTLSSDNYYEDYSSETVAYEVYSYTDGEFVNRLSEKDLVLDKYYSDTGKINEIIENVYNTRGVYADEKLYIVIPGMKVSVYNINTMESLGEINID